MPRCQKPVVCALLVCIVEDGWPLRRAAERFQVAVTTAARWRLAKAWLGIGRAQLRADNASGTRTKNGDPARGCHYLHTAIDAYSRLAHSELLTDERKETAAAFWQRANAAPPGSPR